MKTRLALLAWLAIVLCGCQTYNYRILQPKVAASLVADRPILLHYEPLEYRLWRANERLAMQIENPTGDPIYLLGERSFVVDPQGETHPLRGRVVGPHSFARLLLPPVPFTYAYPDYSWGWGMGWGGWAGWGWPGYGPFWGPFYEPGFFGPPPLTYARAYTVYDWMWKTGPIHLRLVYDRNKKIFDQDFEIVREPAHH